MYNQIHNLASLIGWIDETLQTRENKKPFIWELYFRIDINPLWLSTLSLVSSQTPKLCKLGWVWNPRQPIMLSTHQQQSEPRKLPPLLSTFTAHWFSKLTVHFSSVWLLLGCFWHIKTAQTCTVQIAFTYLGPAILPLFANKRTDYLLFFWR